MQLSGVIRLAPSMVLIWFLFISMLACEPLNIGPRNKFTDKYSLQGNYDYQLYCACTPQVVVRRDTASFFYNLEIEKKGMFSKKMLLKGIKIYKESLLEIEPVEAIVSGNTFTIPSQHAFESGSGLYIEGKGSISKDSIFLEYSYTYRFIKSMHSLKGKR